MEIERRLNEIRAIPLGPRLVGPVESPGEGSEIGKKDRNPNRFKKPENLRPPATLAVGIRSPGIVDVNRIASGRVAGKAFLIFRFRNGTRAGEAGEPLTGRYDRFGFRKSSVGFDNVFDFNLLLGDRDGLSAPGRNNVDRLRFSIKREKRIPPYTFSYSSSVS